MRLPGGPENARPTSAFARPITRELRRTSLTYPTHL